MVTNRETGQEAVEGELCALAHREWKEREQQMFVQLAAACENTGGPQSVDDLRQRFGVRLKTLDIWRARFCNDEALHQRLDALQRVYTTVIEHRRGIELDDNTRERNARFIQWFNTARGKTYPDIFAITEVLLREQQGNVLDAAVKFHDLYPAMPFEVVLNFFVKSICRGVSALEPHIGKNLHVFLKRAIDNGWRNALDVLPKKYTRPPQDKEAPIIPE